MVVFLILLEGWLLIYSNLAIRNGLHIIRYGEEKNRWILRNGDTVRGLVGETVSRLIGYILVFSGIFTVLAAIWLAINFALGDDLPFDIFQPLLCLFFVGMGPLAIVRLISEINRMRNR